MRTFAIVFLALLSMPLLCQAQFHSSADKWQAFVGYSSSRDYGMLNPYSLDNSGNGDEFAAYKRDGYQAEVSYFPTTHFGLTYEMSFFTTGDHSFAAASQGETFSINTQRYLIGPAFRYTLRGGKSRLTLFAHQLFGSSHNHLLDNLFKQDNFSSYSMTLVSGGGVDFRLIRHFSIRPAELEYQSEQLNSEAFFGPNSGQSVKFGVDGFNYSGGAVLNF